MSGISEEAISMTLLPIPDVKSKSSNINKTIKFDKTSISQKTSTGSYVFNSFFTRETKASATPILLNNYLNSKRNLKLLPSNDPLATITKSKKRNRSKPCPASRKRSKKKQLNEAPDEKNLDTDLVSFVESMETDKNLGSDSSGDTIIMGNAVNKELCKDPKITSQTTNKVTAIFPTDKIYPPSIPLANFVPQPKEAHLYHNGLLPPNACSSGAYVLKNVLSKSVPNIDNVSSPFKFPSNLGSLSTIPASSVSKSKAKKTARKSQQKSFMYHPEDILTNNPSESSKKILPFSNSVGDRSSRNFQSIYASMGLDEDLCDVKSQKVEEKFKSNFVPVSSTLSTTEIHSQNPVHNFTNIPIKIEKDATPPASPGNEGSRTSGSLFHESQNSLNKMHIDMTFETDPYDEEDDLPLSVLKSKVDEGSFEASLQCNDTNPYTNQSTCGNIPIPLYIKKELMEDEIVSESHKVSAKSILSKNSNVLSKINLSPSLKATENILNSNSANFNLEVVKIKSEPSTDFQYCDSSKTIYPEALHQDPTNLSAESINKIVPENSTLLKKSKNGKQKSSTKKAGQKSTILPFSSNDVPSASFTNQYKTPETSSEEAATALIVPSKKKVKKTMKHKTTVQSEVNYNLNSESFQNVQCGKSPVLDTNSFAEPLDMASAALDINSDLNITENKTASKKKGKMKKSVHLDENLPITLLIKRHKTTGKSTDGLDSFLCTNVSKSGNEVNKDSFSKDISDKPLFSSTCENLKTSDELLNSKESLIEKLDNPSSSFQNPDLTKIPPKKRKNPPKKKQAKKKGKNDAFGNFERIQVSCEQDNIEQSNNLLNIMDDKEGESSCDTNACNSSNNKETVGSHNEKDGTVVQMSFEEQHSPPDDSSQEFMNSVLSVKKEMNCQLFPNNIVHSRHESTNVLSTIKNIKKEKDTVSEFETYKQSKSAAPDNRNYLLSAQVSELNSSNVNDKDINNPLCSKETNVSSLISENTDSAAKKKKKVKKKSYGWYKKKKQKTKLKDQPITNEVAAAPISDTDLTGSCIATLSDVNVNVSHATPQLDANFCVSATKQPVVVVKNLLPIIEKVALTHEEKKDNLHAESETVLQPSENKKKNSGKRKRAPVSNKKYPNKKLLLGASESENNSLEISKNTDSSISSPSSEKNTVTLEDGNAKSVITRSASDETVYTPFDDLPACNRESEVIDISDSPVKISVRPQPGKRLLSRLIDVDEIAQEIAGLENLVQSYNKHHHEVVNNISDSSEINTDECTSKTPEIEIRNQPSASLRNSSIKHAIGLNILTKPQNLNLIEPLAKIKKEPDAYGISKANIDGHSHDLSSLFDISSTLLPVHNSISSKTLNSDDRSELLNPVSVKTEASTDSISCKQSLGHNSNKSPNTSDNNEHQSKSCTNMSKNLECSHLKSTEPSDKIALSIKKEVCSDTVYMASVNSIRNQNELLDRVSEICSESVTNNLSINNSSSRHELNSASSQTLQSKTSVAVLQRSAETMTDDEIQILEVNAQKSKNVPCVDLTNDDASKLVSRVQVNDLLANNSKNLSSELYDNNKSVVHGNLISEKISHEAASKETNFSGIENKEAVPSNKDSQSTKLPSERNIFHSSFIDEDLCPSADKETIDPFTISQKYISEYFRYPFPPSVASFHSKPQKKHKTYTRINSQTLNLSIEKVESRLKNSNIKHKFGNKLGDIVKLERYPVSSSEVECFHRILGIAPSHKLLSKCFKSSDEKSSSVLNEFNLFPEFQGQSIASKFESKNPSIVCSLQDIIQGISESRMACNKSGIQTLGEIYKRDCPSIDTKDSCDSFTSSISDKFLNSVEKNKNLLLKDNDLINLCQDASSSGRNSALSCAASDLQDSIKNDSALLSFSGSRNSLQELSAHSSDVKETYFSQNISYLTLPSSEVIDSLNESNRSLTNIDTHEESVNTVAELKKPVLSNELHSLPNSNNQVISAPSSAGNSYICSNTNEDGNELQKLSNPILNNIDILNNLPVTELRKILEVAGSFCPSSNTNDVNSWKKKETFEYNHTHSVPVTGINSDHDLENTTFNSRNSFDAAVEDVSNREDIKIDPVHENSDDDYVDNEPQGCESDVDRNETSDLNEEEPKIPQYKSKWEKIMERKSLESKQKEQMNEHLLKDCFPVSSKVPSKKCNVPNKISINATPKTSEKKKTESREIKKSKSDQKPASAKKEQSKVITKKKEKGKIVNHKTEIESKECKKESKILLKKKKGKYVDAAANLFVPDKPVKFTDGKKAESIKSNDGNSAKRFYGNRITNRGTFLTESTSELIKKIKIPKRKIPEVPKKLVNVRSEEFHSMVKSPDIDIEPRDRSRYNRANLIVVTGKSNDYEKKTKYFDRGSSSTSSSILMHPPDRDKFKRLNFVESQPLDLLRPYHENIPNRKVPLSSNLSFPLQSSDENNRKVPLINSPPFHTNDESYSYRRASVLDTPSMSYPSKDSSFPSTNVPFINIPPSTSVVFPPSKNVLHDKSPPLTLLQNILSTVQSNSSISSNDTALPFSGYLNPAWNNNQFPSTPGQPYFSDVSDSMSDSLIINASCATDLPSVACNLVPGPPSSSFQFHNQPNHPFDSAGNSQFVTPLSSNQISHSSKKASSTCLVPQHLKSLVGHKTVETSNVRLLMLEWSVDWLVQQQKFHDPPPIYKTLKKVVSSYESFEDYYNTYFPLMLLDTWHRIYVSWTHLSQASPYFCEISSYSVKSNYVSVECQTVFNSTDHPKGVFPDEGSILMIKYGTKSNEFAIKVLGYVTSVKTRRFNPVTDSKLCNFKPPKDGNFEILNVLTLTFMGAYNSEDIDKHLPIRIHVLCNVRSTLKQNDALLYISKSPLQRSILNPVDDGLLSFSLTPRNSPQDKVNECVRDITKGILSPHPLPLLTVVRAVPESDRLNIIPLLIEKMKNGYKTKVLLCVRTVRALGDIAANICLHKSLKMLIINKRCDTSVQFQRYLLDELVASEISKSENNSSERHLAKNETVIRIKKQIFSESDVILSLIRNSHDEFMETTFTETESVAQMCCIVDEANLCTEPETLIPVLHGISKLILIGDPDYPAKVLSKTAREYDYNRSFFHRAYDLDLITE